MAGAPNRDDHPVPGRQRSRRDRPRGRQRLGGPVGPAGGRDNRDGASGTIGFNALAAATPDGSTIAFGPTTPIANAPYLVKGVRYQVESFDYLCQIFENVFTIAVTPQSKFKSVHDLITAAKENPGKLTYGHAGTGTIPHLAVENFAEALNLKFQAVPFRGDAPVLPTLLKGDIDFGAPAVIHDPRAEFSPACWCFGRPGIRPIRTCRSLRELGTHQRGAAGPQRPLRAKRIAGRYSRRRWSGIAPMP